MWLCFRLGALSVESPIATLDINCLAPLRCCELAIDQHLPDGVFWHVDGSPDHASLANRIMQCIGSSAASWLPVLSLDKKASCTWICGQLHIEHMASYFDHSATTDESADVILKSEDCSSDQQL